MRSKTKSKKKRMGYASLASVQQAILLHKEGKLKPPIDASKLRALGIPEWNMFVLYHALEDLNLIHDRYPTETFDRLARAYQTDQVEYQNILETLLKSVYAEVFVNLNPAQATQEQYYAAFADYDFPKQHRKMIALFRGLSREAGLISDETVSDESRVPQEASEPITDVQSFASPLNDVLPTLEEYRPMSELPQTRKSNGSMQASSDYSLVEELLTSLEQLHQLLKNSDWTEKNRAMWVKYLKINHNLLGKALELAERNEK